MSLELEYKFQLEPNIKVNYDIFKNNFMFLSLFKYRQLLKLKIKIIPNLEKYILEVMVELSKKIKEKIMVIVKIGV